MKKSILKALSLLLCAVLFCAVTAPGLSARAASSGSLAEGIGWSFDNGVFTITGNGAVPMGATKKATGAFADQITGVTVGSGITALDAAAFRTCANLKTVTLPDTLRFIPKNCFMGCAALKEISIPAGVQLIGSMAFMQCTALEKVSLPADLHAIGSDAFNGCTALKSISLPGKLTSIGFEAFMNTGLTSVTLPGSVRSIDSWAFAQCKDLKNAILSCGLATLPQCVFQNSALEYVVIPKSIRTADEAAFYNCTLQEIYYEGTQAEFESIAIVNNGLENVAGTTSKLFETAALHTAKVETDLLNTKGDLDGKDGVTANDARDVLRAAVQLDPIAEATAAYYAADVDLDGSVTASDARLVLRAAVKLEELESLQPYQPKAVSEDVLKELEAFNGTYGELLEKYDVELLYGENMTWGEGAALFRGEKDMLVMLFAGNKPAYFKQRFTPAVSSEKAAEITKETAVDELKALDPGLAENVFKNMTGPATAADLLCTTDGFAYLILLSGGKAAGCVRF